MAQICVTLADETTAALIDRMVDTDAHADLFEIRGDLVRDLDLLTLLRARSKPLLFTCRAVSEGGKAKDAHPERKEMLLEAVKRGFAYVDVEHRVPILEVVAGKAGKGLVVSFHDLEGTPDDLDALYADMCARGADVVKIVVTPRTFADVARLLEFAARRAKAKGTPLVTHAMGSLGVPSRILAGRFGAPFTFASSAAGAEAAPGQVPARVMDELYRVRRISERTKVYGIVGTDVSRSLSPQMHNRAFAACGLDAVYLPLETDSLESLLGARRTMGLSGLSVTRPYKMDIVPLLQSVDEEAALAGSVNTVVVEGDRLRGFSTDGIGVVGPLEQHLPLEGASVVVLGGRRGRAGRGLCPAEGRGRGDHTGPRPGEGGGSRPRHRLRLRAALLRGRATLRRGRERDTPGRRSAGRGNAPARLGLARGSRGLRHGLRPPGNAVPARGPSGGGSHRLRP